MSKKTRDADPLDNDDIESFIDKIDTKISSKLIEKVVEVAPAIRRVKKGNSMLKYRVTNKTLQALNLVIDGCTVQLAAKQSTTIEFKRALPLQLNNLKSKGMLLLEKLAE